MFRYEKEQSLRHDDHRGGRHGGHRHHGHGGRHGSRHHGWGGEDEGRGGRRRRVFDSGELRLVLLKLIADEPRHGYELIRAIEELSGGLYAPSPGVIYPTLTMLHEMAQIEEAAPSNTQSGGARKAFSVTAEGTAHLAAHKADVDALLARLAELSSARRAHRRRPDPPGDAEPPHRPHRSLRS